MKKISVLILLVTIVTLVMNSCSKSDDAAFSGLQLQSPYDVQWKLIAFGEASPSKFSTMNTERVNAVISPDAEKAYLLTFKRDSTFTGSSSVNTISGKISIDERRGTLAIKEISGVKNTEVGDGASYLDRLSKVEYFEVTYKNNEKYLRLSYPKDKRYFLDYKALPAK